eukprot:s9168_g2.t1
MTWFMEFTSFATQALVTTSTYSAWHALVIWNLHDLRPWRHLDLKFAWTVQAGLDLATWRAQYGRCSAHSSRVVAWLCCESDTGVEVPACWLFSWAAWETLGHGRREPNSSLMPSGECEDRMGASSALCMRLQVEFVYMPTLEV